MEIVRICKEYGYTEEEYWDLSEEFTLAIRARRQVEANIRAEQNKEMERQANSIKNKR